MKKFLLSTIVPAIALMALNANAASLANSGALTISWTISQQAESLTNTSVKTNAVGKKATNVVSDYKAATKSSSFNSASLLGLLSNSFPTKIVAGDKLATDGEYIYVADKTGSNLVLADLSPILTVAYSNSIVAGAAAITTNTAESTPVTNITTQTNITSALGTNVTTTTNIIAVTNIVTTATNPVVSGTNIDIVLTGTNYTTNTTLVYTTNYTYTTNVYPETTIVTTATNIVVSTNTDIVFTGTTYTTNTTVVYATNYTYTNIVVPETNIVSTTNLVYTTNFVYTTNIVDTKLSASGNAAYTTTSYFTLTYKDTNTETEFTFNGLASTVNDVNLAKDTGSENFSVKNGSGTGTINGKTTVILGTITGSAKGAASPPAE
jgi:hypothetical protein